MTARSRSTARSHRHLVAAPLFALALALPIAAIRGGQPALASLASPDEPGIVLELSNGAHALPDDESTLLHVSDEGNLLRGGAILVKTEGIETVAAGALSFTGWNGAFRVASTGERISVAAVSTPVLVSDASGTVLLIPSGMQWEAPATLAPLTDGLLAWSADRVPLPLPGIYVVETLHRLNDLPAHDAILGHEAAVGPSFLQLPAARAQSDVGAVRAVLGELLTLAEAGDTAGFLVTLGSLPDPSVLAAVDARGMLARVVSRSAEHPGMIAQVLPLFVTRSDRWLLAAFHPAVRSQAWLLPIPSFTQEEDLLRLRLLPGSDVLAEGLVPQAVDRWAEGMEAAFLDAREPAGVLEFFASAIHAALLRGERLGYTERTVRYAEALLALTDPWKENLPQTVEAAVEDAQRIVGR